MNLLRFVSGVLLALVAAALLLGPSSGPVRAQEKANGPKKIPIILDCDIGTDIDDTFALALAVLSPEIELRGVTTVSGDTQTRALMACRLLTLAGRKEVPVAAGLPEKPPQPLRGVQEQYARHPAVIFNRTSRPLKQSAVEFIYQQLKSSPGEITLVAVGPESNIAQLLTEHPDCKPWIKRIVVMGGAVRVGYNNKPPPGPEFNIRADVAAARTVFGCGVPLVVAPLDATTMLQLDPAMLARIFATGSMLNFQVQNLFQLWDQKSAPTMYDPVAVTLVFTERFCKMEELCLAIDDNGLTRETSGKPNARVAVGIDKDAYLKWFVDRFAQGEPAWPQPPQNRSQLVPRGNFPNRVHTFEDYETDIEKRWWMSGKAEKDNLPPGSSRANRGVLTLDFDDRMGNTQTAYTAVVFNPVPGPPMGKNPRLSFRYWLKGTDTLRIQIYSLTNGYHRYLSLTGLPQQKWHWAAVDMSQVRRPDGSGGPLAENERIDDIQFYVDPRAEVLIDDVVLYDAALPEEKRPFPKNIHYTGWFDSGKQGKEWPGNFDIAPKKGYFWHAAQSVDNPDRDGPWLRLSLRGERTLGGATHLFFRYHLTGADSIRVVLVNRTQKDSHVVELKGLKQDQWADASVDFAHAPKSQPKRGDRVDELHFLLPKGATLLLDDVLLYEPGE